MKLGPVTKLDKRNTVTSKKKKKKINDAVILANCGIVIFPIYGKFGKIRTPDSGCMLCKTYIFTNSNLISYKKGKQN